MNKGILNSSYCNSECPFYVSLKFLGVDIVFSAPIYLDRRWIVFVKILHAYKHCIRALHLVYDSSGPTACLTWYQEHIYIGYVFLWNYLFFTTNLWYLSAPYFRNIPVYMFSTIPMETSNYLDPTRAEILRRAKIRCVSYWALY